MQNITAGVVEELCIRHGGGHAGKDFIELARGVYFNNDDRSKIKLKINKLLKSNIREVKQYVDYN